MNVLAMTGFLQSLSQKTIDGEIKWSCISDLMTNSKEENHALSNLLHHSIRHINIFNSYYCFLPNSGFVYFLEETVEKGIVVSGLYVYIQKNLSSNIYRLDVSLEIIYQLRNAIQNSNHLKDQEIQSFIDNYFNE